MSTRVWWLGLLAGAAFGLVGCGDDDDKDEGQGELEISGSWVSNYGSMEVIDSTTWTSYAEVPIIEYDNDANFLITQNPDDAQYDPGKFNKIVWTEIEDDHFYYCTVAYGLDSAEEARDAEDTSDDKDPENDGCGGFPWTRLDAAP